MTDTSIIPVHGKIRALYHNGTRRVNKYGRLQARVRKSYQSMSSRELTMSDIYDPARSAAGVGVATNLL